MRRAVPRTKMRSPLKPCLSPSVIRLGDGTEFRLQRVGTRPLVGRLQKRVRDFQIRWVVTPHQFGRLLAARGVGVAPSRLPGPLKPWVERIRIMRMVKRYGLETAFQGGRDGR